MVVIDGKDLILGRLASHTAGLALRGKRVDVINAENVIVSGKKGPVLNRWKQRYDISCRVNPDRGRKSPRTPEGLVKRTIRGMVGHKTPRGSAAFKLVKVHRGIPNEFAGIKAASPEGAKNIGLVNYVTMRDISEKLGYGKWN